MATMRCPNCSSEIKKPTSTLAIVLGILAFFSIGGIMLIIVCLAAISAIGANVNEELERAKMTNQIEATKEVGFTLSVPSEMDVETTRDF